MRFLRKLYNYNRWPISSDNLGGREYVSHYRDRPFTCEYFDYGNGTGFHDCQDCYGTFSTDEYCSQCARCILCCPTSQLEKCQVCNSSHDLTRHYCYHCFRCRLLCREHNPTWEKGCGCPFCSNYCVNCKQHNHTSIPFTILPFRDPFLLSTCPHCTSSRAKELQILKPRLPLDLCKVIMSFYGFPRIYMPVHIDRDG